MNTPSPLIPQGSLQNQSRGGQNVRIAVLTIVALHAVIFVGLLMQGCHRGGEDSQEEAAKQTSPTATEQETNYYPPIEDQYYSDYRQLTNEALSNPAATAASGANTNSAGATADSGRPVVTNQTATATNEAPSTGNALSGVSGRQGTVERETPAARSEERTHEIKKGDMLGQLASTYKVSLQNLVNANPGIDPRKLRIGQKIKIPASAPQEERAAAVSAADSKDVHVVKKGENLSVIAAKHGTTVPALKSANNLATDLIRVDQKLVIPLASSNRVTR